MEEINKNMSVVEMNGIKVRMSDIKLSCRSNQCSAKVLIWTTNTVHGVLVNRALNKLRRRDGFRQVFIVRRWQIETNRLTGRKWEVVLPYKISYQNSNADR